VKRDTTLGKIGTLTLSFVPSAVVSTFALWIVFSGIAIGLLQVPILKGIIGALAAVIVHWLSETAHQLGHAWAAHRVGHPMAGIRYWGVLSTSLYPPDEGQLPARLHIRRALGGPSASFALSIVAGIVVLLIPSRGTLWLVALFFFLDNLLVFTIGALIPLGFNDGSTLLHWMRAGDRMTPMSP
jgi:hypothetical protein